MSDFFEIDFLDVRSKKSGDAIPIRYSFNGSTRIHVTDGGFQDTGDSVIEHINKYYGAPSYIDALVVTHPDGDHAGGLRKLFDTYKIGELWMLRPWLYAYELIDRFSRFTSVNNLIERLKDLYPNIAALEELAEEHKVPILDPFQGALIGNFWVLAPSKSRYLDLIVESDKTPEAIKEKQMSFGSVASRLAKNVINFIRSAWGDEAFPLNDTSAENNMSVIQYANLCGKKILLTGDAGRAALEEAADYAPSVGLSLPGIDRIQVPHHGSRHNVSTEILDRWLGPRLPSQQEGADPIFIAVVCASKDDENHPKNTVVRAFIHRGAEVLTTQDGHKVIGNNWQQRDGWHSVKGVPYPHDQEEL